MNHPSVTREKVELAQLVTFLITDTLLSQRDSISSHKNPDQGAGVVAQWQCVLGFVRLSLTYVVQTSLELVM